MRGIIGPNRRSDTGLSFTYISACYAEIVNQYLILELVQSSIWSQDTKTLGMNHVVTRFDLYARSAILAPDGPVVLRVWPLPGI